MSHETRTSPPTYPEILEIHDGAFSESIWGSDGFRTIKVSGQSDVVADSYKDDLTIAAGTNVTITTNASGDAVTIASTPYTAGNGLQLSGNEFAVTALAITSVQEAANQTAHLALTTQQGDVVVRADENKSYVRNAGTAGDMSDFTLLKTPTDLVLSVHGNTGAITANQIAAAVEAATDSNTFTDADHSKLNAIEASATADQTSTEIKSLLASDNITGTHIADDAIDSEHYIDGSIDHAHLSGDCVDGDNIGDDSINSEHYVDGSIDEQHISNDAVTYAKMQDVSATDRILGRDSSGAGIIEEITPANLRTMINVEDGADVTDATNVNSAGAVMHSDIDGKGELLVGDGAGDASVLAAGTNNHILTADSNESTGLKWRAENAHTDKVNQNAFSNVAVSGQTTVAADSATDTLNLAAGTNVTLTTNASSDTVTIAAADTSKLPTAGGTITGNVTVTDSTEIRWGSDADLIIFHNGTDSFIKETTGNLDIRAKNTSGGLVTISDSAGENLIKATAGSSVELTYDGTKKIETSTQGVWLGDNSRVTFGNTTGTPDFHIYHDATDTNLQNITGDIVIKSTSGGAKAIVVKNAAAVELYHNNIKKLETTSAGVTVTGGIIAGGLTYPTSDGSNGQVLSTNGSGTLSFSSAGSSFGGANGADVDDNVKLRFGASNDLEIFHDATTGHSRIKDTGTGNLALCSSKFTVWNAADNEAMIEATEDGAVDLYHNGTKSVETVSGGILVKGIEGGNCQIYMQADEGDDDADKWLQLALASGSEWQLRNFSNGSSWETNIQTVGAGKASLYYDNSEKLETTSDGVKLGDSVKLVLGADGDAKLYDTGSKLWLDIFNNHDFGISTGAGNENSAAFKANGAVELYYDDSKKFQTTSSGVHCFGQLEMDGSNNIDLQDNGALLLGTGDDLQIYHDGSHSYITDTGTGRLHINTSELRVNNAADNEILISATENGAVELYYDSARKIYTSPSGVVIQNDAYFQNDASVLYMGADNDGRIFHSGSNFHIRNTTGNLYLEAKADENSIRCDADGQVRLYYDAVQKFNTSSSGAQVHGDLFFDDDNKLKIGTSQDLQIYHDGSNSWIRDTTGTNQTIIEGAGGIDFRHYSTGEMLTRMVGNGAVELYYDNVKKLETTSTGVKVIGDLHFDNATNAGQDIIWDESASVFNFEDSVQATFGDSGDLQLYHNGSYSFLNHSGTGNLYIRNSTTNADLEIQAGLGGELILKVNAGEKCAQFNTNGSSELYYDDGKKLETASHGTKIIEHNDLRLDSGNWTGESGTGTAKIQCHANHLYLQDGGGKIIFRHSNGTEWANFLDTGHFEPMTNNTFDLGTSSKRWRNVYVNDLQLSNKGSQNSVDGTWGDWTLQEGEDDIFMLNNRTGKKYKMSLTEVS